MLPIEHPIKRSIFVALVFITPLGFFAKLYPGPGRYWFNNYGAGVLYEIFWCLILLFFWPKRENITKIAASVFTATVFLEALQLWHPWVLERARSTFLGAALIGTTFSWWDFPHYLLGCAIGWLFMHRLLKVKL